jgi:hypothetical protein
MYTRSSIAAKKDSNLRRNKFLIKDPVISIEPKYPLYNTKKKENNAILIVPSLQQKIVIEVDTKWTTLQFSPSLTTAHSNCANQHEKASDPRSPPHRTDTICYPAFSSCQQFIPYYIH